jgi:hypothetical protein
VIAEAVLKYLKDHAHQLDLNIQHEAASQTRPPKAAD